MKYALSLLIFVVFWSCSNGQKNEENTKEYSNIENSTSGKSLYRVSENTEYELGMEFGYVNKAGDTIVPFGKYSYSFTDTISNFGIVGGTKISALELVAIDRKGNKLFEVYRFDNGPDYLQEGLFRILRNGKIGFANANGEIIIKPQFQCASPFENGKAKVAFQCKQNNTDDEHSEMISDSWFFIDKTGNKVN